MRGGMRDESCRVRERHGAAARERARKVGTGQGGPKVGRRQALCNACVWAVGMGQGVPEKSENQGFSGFLGNLEDFFDLEEIPKFFLGATNGFWGGGTSPRVRETDSEARGTGAQARGTGS